MSDDRLSLSRFLDDRNNDLCRLDQICGLNALLCRMNILISNRQIDGWNSKTVKNVGVTTASGAERAGGQAQTADGTRAS